MSFDQPITKGDEMSGYSSRRGFLKSTAVRFGAGLAVVTAAGCGTAGTGAVPASSKLNEVLKRGTVIVGTGSTNPPWHFEDEKGALQGFDIEMARLLAKGLFDDPAKCSSCGRRPMHAFPICKPGRSMWCFSS